MSRIGAICFIFSISISKLLTAQFESDIPLAFFASNGNGSTMVRTGDIDNDGDQDIISASISSTSIVWSENLGNGVFTVPKLVADYSGNSLEAICVSDVDGDGYVDVISTVLSTPSYINWSRNLGNGTFGPLQLITDLAWYPQGIFTTDLDNDGDEDLLSASSADDKIAWYENLGNGTFGSQQIVSVTCDGAWDVYSQDLDNDGDKDILVASTVDNKLAWFSNLGNGTFGSEQIISILVVEPRTVYAEDLDNDGDYDVISASRIDGEISWFENVGGGVFGVQQIVSTLVVVPESVYAEDINNDGYMDILSASLQDDKIAWYSNLGNGTFGVQQVIPSTTNGASCIYAKDLDNDGDVEVLSSSYFDKQLTWYENLGAGVLGVEQILSQRTDGASFIMGLDVNNDGLTDVISASSQDSKLAWYKNLGNDDFQSQQLISDSAYSVYSCTSIDVNGDSYLDLIVASRGMDQISWLENMGGVSFGSEQIITNLVDGIRYVISADLDGDGDLDIASTSCVDDKLAWYENLGNGSFGAQQVISTQGDCAIGISASDLDNDGDLDIVSTASLTSQMSWYENLGGGIFSTQNVIATTGTAPREVKAADINGDGQDDLVVAWSADNSISWYENVGLGTFGSGQVIATGLTGVELVNCLDIDNDGDLDIVAGYQNSMAWVENINNGVFGSPSIVTTIGNSIRSLNSSDLDNDGDQDLLTAGYNIDRVSWHKNTFLNPNQVRGTLYIDENLNNVKDTNEVGLSMLEVLSSPQNSFAYTYANGEYQMNMNPLSSGLFQIQPDALTNWSIVTDSLLYNVFIDSTFSYLDSADFGFYPDNYEHSVVPELVGGFPSCDDTINYWLNVQNVGTTKPNGIVHLHLDNNIQYISSLVIPDSIIGQDIYWHYDSLNYFSNENININVLMPDFNFMGDTLASTLTVSVDSLSTQLYSDSSILSQILVCAYDPNDKISDPIGFDIPGYISPSTNSLDYTIRFQNTGTNVADDVVIQDQLDTNLVWSTLSVLATSHDMDLNVNLNGEVEFIFNNIMLPDSNVNFLGSQGFVKYRIDIKSNTPVGTSIYNTGEIYFDANSAIITNTKVNTLFDCAFSLNGLEDSMTTCGNSYFTLFDFGLPTEYQWDIANVISDSGSVLNWYADTSGIFTMNITKINEFCDLDTSIQLVAIEAIPISSLNAVQICDGDSVQIFSEFQSLPGLYSDTLNASNGCDSIIQKELIVFPYLGVNDLGITQVCENDSALIFNNYTGTSGVYFDTIQSLNGCDSILQIELVVSNLPVVSIGTLSIDTICVNENQLPLNSGIPVGGVYSGVGVTSSVFDPVIAGIGVHSIYYSFTDAFGCTNIDSSFIVVDGCVGSIELSKDPLIVYPNPASDFVTIKLGSNFLDRKIQVIDNLGQLIITKEITTTNPILDVRELSSGVYVIKVDNIRTRLIIK
ncbi:MAG: putative repeat protein (TIGR01451 family) [Crocinitomicaceae bacterium]|jgi:uncharacterized repeat protein (TIGR01451 family)